MNIKSPSDLMVNGTFKAGILSALKCMLFSKTVVENMRPAHIAASNAAMAEFKPVVEDREIYRQSKRLNNSVNTPIEDFEKLYLASDKAAREVYDFYYKKMANSGFERDGDKCPWLVANNTHCTSERLLIDVMQPYTKVSNTQLHIKGKRAKYIDVITGLLVSIADDEGISLNIIAEAINA